MPFVRFVPWLVPTVNRFPKSQRFLLGDRIQNAAIDVLEDTSAATVRFCWSDSVVDQMSSVVFLQMLQGERRARARGQHQGVSSASL